MQTPLTQTGQFTYQVEQKLQCLSMALFLSLPDEIQPRAICETHRGGGSGVAERRSARRRWRQNGVLSGGYICRPE